MEKKFKVLFVLVFILILSMSLFACGQESHNVTKDKASTDLKYISLNAGTITPIFSAEKTDYEVKVEEDISRLFITTIPKSKTATVKVNNIESIEGKGVVELALGYNDVKIEVTDGDETVKIYNLKVIKLAEVEEFRAEAICDSTISMNSYISNQGQQLQIANENGDWGGSNLDFETIYPIGNTSMFKNTSKFAILKFDVTGIDLSEAYSCFLNTVYTADGYQNYIEEFKLDIWDIKEDKDHYFIDELSVGTEPTSIKWANRNILTAGIGGKIGSFMLGLNHQAIVAAKAVQFDLGNYLIHKEPLVIGDKQYISIALSTDTNTSGTGVLKFFAHEIYKANSARAPFLQIFTKKDVTKPSFNDAKVEIIKVTNTTVDFKFNKAVDNEKINKYTLYNGDKLLGKVNYDEKLIFSVKDLDINTEYDFLLFAEDDNCNVSEAYNVKFTTLNVTSAPTFGTNAIISVVDIGYKTATLNWDVASDEAGVDGYKIYNSNGLMLKTNIQDNSVTLDFLKSNTNYNLIVKAYNIGGVESQTGLTVSFKTLEDNEVPVWEDDSFIQYKKGQSYDLTTLTLQWGGATDNVDIKSYNIYMSNNLIGTVESTEKAEFCVNGLITGTLYNFAIEAVDSSGNISDKKQYSAYPFTFPQKIYPEGVDLSESLARFGYLDVTKAPYNADNTGKTDVTEVLQQALLDGYEYGLATYLPLGTYLVSNTLDCEVFAGVHAAERDERPGFVFIGESGGGEDKNGNPIQPIIKLAANSMGFNDPDPYRIKPVIYYHHTDGGDRPNMNMNQVLRGITFDITAENLSGAYAIDLRGCEGSSVSDCVVYAYGAFAGIKSICGSGGSVAGLTVYGGKYGIYSVWNQESPCAEGIKLYYQTDYAIFHGQYSPLTITGIEIIKKSGPVICLRQKIADNSTYADGPLNKNYGSGAINLVDGVITIEDGGSTVIDNTKAMVYMKNVYIKGSNEIISNSEDGSVYKSLGGTDYTRIVEFAYNYNYNGNCKMLNGVETNSTYCHLEKATTYNKDIVSQHLWEGGSSFLAPDQEDITNVKDYGAIGDGVADDTLAIQRAIDKSESGKVFLPRGLYKVTDTILLKSNTNLFGVARHISILFADNNIGFGAINERKAIVATPNDADATCAVGNMLIKLPVSSTLVYALDWQSGRNSICKDVWIKSHTTGSPNVQRYKMKITNNGGGKIYNFLQENGWDTINSKSRSLYVEGTTEPLRFYMLHTQYQASKYEAQAEFKNVKNVYIYGAKKEGGVYPADFETYTAAMLPASIWFKNCNNIFIVGSSGNMQLKGDDTLPLGKGIYLFENCTEVTFAGSAGNTSTGDTSGRFNWQHFEEVIFGARKYLSANYDVALYKRTAEDITKYYV